MCIDTYSYLKEIKKIGQPGVVWMLVVYCVMMREILERFGLV